MTNIFKSIPGRTGSLEYSTEIQPHDVSTPSIASGLSPIFFMVKVEIQV